MKKIILFLPLLALACSTATAATQPVIKTRLMQKPAQSASPTQVETCAITAVLAT